MTRERAHDIAQRFIAWNEKHKGRVPEPLASDMLEFTDWLLAESRRATPSPHARELLRIFSIR